MDEQTIGAALSMMLREMQYRTVNGLKVLESLEKISEGQYRDRALELAELLQAFAARGKKRAGTASV